MKKIMFLLLLIVNTTAFSATQPVTNAQPVTNVQPATITQPEIQAAMNGCQKSIGFFPTPAKLTCLLTALGLPQKQTKAKQLAVIFSVCSGHTTMEQPKGTMPKSYETLGACLNDPSAIEVINKELANTGFQPVKVVNPSVLGPSANVSPKAT